jgi:hypothetical protein
VIEELEQKTLPPTVRKHNGEVAQPSSPIRTSSSPSYAEIIKKKPPENSRSSEDESFERP